MSEELVPQEPRTIPTDPQGQMFLVRDILYADLAGHQSAREICRAIGLEPTREHINYVANRMATAEYIKQRHEVERDLIASVTDWFKMGVFRWAYNMDKMAQGKAVDGDGKVSDKVAFQACKDLLDRAGTGGTLKIVAGTPADYRKIAEEYLEPKKELKA